MEPEKTLLQQIREKEQEYAQKIESVKKETDLAVEAARNDAEALLCTADGTGKADAERLYWEGKAKTETEIEVLKRSAVAEREAAAATGDKNVSRAVDAITAYVTME
jgi:vacuolar-type H+-ATPase subunit H